MRARLRAVFLALLAAGFLVALVLVLGALLYWRDPFRFQAAVPSIIVPEIAAALTRKHTYLTLYFTLYLAFRGLLLGLIGAAVVGVVFGLYPKVVNLLMPVPNALRAIPLTLLIPFLVAFPPLLILPPGIRADLPDRDPVYLIALGTLLYLVIGIAEGIARRDVDREMIFKRVHGYSAVRYLLRILFFESLPHFLASLRLAVLFAFVLAVVFEQLIPLPGVGRSISDLMAQSLPTNSFEARALSLLFVVAAVGVLIDAFFLVVRRLVVQWER